MPPAASEKINVKERVDDDTIDLSLSDITEIPIKEIASFKRATILDLSSNHITSLVINYFFLSINIFIKNIPYLNTSLQISIGELAHLTKLDLSKNSITVLPDEIGKLIKLRHFDLYNNKIEHVPLAFGQLKSLRYLDLKGNPLSPALAKMVGPCLTTKECQTAAKVTVQFMNDYQIKQKELKIERQRQIEEARHAAKLEAENKKKLEEKQKAKLKRDKKKQKLKEKQLAATGDGEANGHIANGDASVRNVSCRGPSICKLFVFTGLLWLLVAIGIVLCVTLLPKHTTTLIESLPSAYQAIVNRYVADARNYLLKHFTGEN